MVRRDPEGSIFRKIAADLRARILSGEFSPGSKLPSEAYLGFQYDAGKWAIGEAISFLRVEGYLEPYVPGRGTVVRGRPAMREIAYGLGALVRGRAATVADVAKAVDEAIEPGMEVLVVEVGEDVFVYRRETTAIRFY